MNNFLLFFLFFLNESKSLLNLDLKACNSSRDEFPLKEPAGHTVKPRFLPEGCCKNSFYIFTCFYI